MSNARSGSLTSGGLEGVIKRREGVVRRVSMMRHVLIGTACVGLTLVSGVGDTYGFVHATGAWRGGALVVSELARSAIGFAVGIATYWLVVRYLAELGVRSTTLQTLGWFAVTIVGVAVVSGDVARWSPINQVIAGAVVAGVGWLLVNAGAA
jgi:hypothetical protein